MGNTATNKIKKTVDWEELPEDKQAAINIYYQLLLKKNPNWKQKKILRKVGEYFNIKFEIEGEQQANSQVNPT